MSAYVVNDETISVLVKAFEIYGIDYRADDYQPPNGWIVNLNEERKRIGQSLLKQNYKSVNYRYREDEKPREFEYKDVDLVSNGSLDTGLIFGCIECYECQADETKEYEQSRIHESFVRLKGAMLERYIDQSGHEIKWGYNK